MPVLFTLGVTLFGLIWIVSILAYLSRKLFRKDSGTAARLPPLASSFA